MFRIRRVYDITRPKDRDLIPHIQRILKEQFTPMSESDLLAIPEQMQNPFKFKFRTIVFVAEKAKGRLAGFAILMHSIEPSFCFLDFISVNPREGSGGVGGALYERVRSEAQSLKTLGVFMECLPDDHVFCKDKTLIRQNAARLRFYEKFGVYPIVNTAYEKPIKEADLCPPNLLYDSLGRSRALGKKEAKKIVRAVLERRYGDLCPPGYIEMVVNSFKDDPVRLRRPRYVKVDASPPTPRDIPEDMLIALTVTDCHRIHHVRRRGYVESPARIQPILEGIQKTGLFRQLPVRHYSDRHIRAIHDPEFVDYLSRVCARIAPDESVYPYVFPLRNQTRKPLDLPIRAGYYCLDTFTPISRNAFDSAKRAVDCALSAAEALLQNHRLAYALIRPPGHHAEKRAFGGFCYFNSAAVATELLSRHGKVAVLDIDYHHGNGTQTIFYDRSDVLTVSLHGHPRFAYPYFTGFADETGNGPGEGFNWNLPLKEKLDGKEYRAALKQALSRIMEFAPVYLVVALGLDTAKADPTGTWSLTRGDFEANGEMIGGLRLPTLAVQEGGYRVRNLGANAQGFFSGLWRATFGDDKKIFSPNRKQGL